MFDSCQSMHVVHEHHHYYYYPESSQRTVKHSVNFHKKNHSSDALIKSSKLDIFQEEREIDLRRHSEKTFKKKCHKGISLTSRKKQDSFELQRFEKFQSNINFTNLEKQYKINDPHVRFIQYSKNISHKYFHQEQKVKDLQDQQIYNGPKLIQPKTKMTSRDKFFNRNLKANQSQRKPKLFFQENPERSQFSKQENYNNQNYRQNMFGFVQEENTKQLKQMHLINTKNYKDELEQNKLNSLNSTNKDGVNVESKMMKLTQRKGKDISAEQKSSTPKIQISLVNSDYFQKNLCSTKKKALVENKTNLYDAVSIISKNVTESVDDFWMEESFVMKRSLDCLQQISQKLYSIKWELYLGMDRSINFLVSIKVFEREFENCFIQEMQVYHHLASFSSDSQTKYLEYYQYLSKQSNSHPNCLSLVFIKEPYEYTLDKYLLSRKNNKLHSNQTNHFIFNFSQFIEKLLLQFYDKFSLVLKNNEVLELDDFVIRLDLYKIHNLYKFKNKDCQVERSKYIKFHIQDIAKKIKEKINIC